MDKRTTTWATPSHPTSRYCCCYLTAAEGALHMTSEHKETNYASNLQYVFNLRTKVPFQDPFSVAKIVIHMQGLHQTAPFPQNKELVWMK